MKTTTLVLFLFVLGIPAGLSAQFIREDKLWSYTRTGSIPSPYTSFYHRMTGDTLIDELNYTRVYKSSDENHLNWSLEGFIRETDTGTVFYRDTYMDDETLLYDFGMEVGDSICGYWVEGYFYLDSIRSRPYGIYQEARDYYYLSYKHNHLCGPWIEGVGNILGVLTKIEFNLSVGEYRYPLCFSEHDSLKYINSQFNTCYLNTVPVKETPLPEFEVRVLGREILVTPLPEMEGDIRVEIYDLQGRKLQSSRQVVAGTVHINLNHLEAGMYIYRLRCGSYSQSAGFLIE